MWDHQAFRRDGPRSGRRLHATPRRSTSTGRLAVGTRRGGRAAKAASVNQDAREGGFWERTRGWWRRRTRVTTGDRGRWKKRLERMDPLKSQCREAAVALELILQSCPPKRSPRPSQRTPSAPWLPKSGAGLQRGVDAHAEMMTGRRRRRRELRSAGAPNPSPTPSRVRCSPSASTASRA